MEQMASATSATQSKVAVSAGGAANTPAAAKELPATREQATAAKTPAAENKVQATKSPSAREAGQPVAASSEAHYGVQVGACRSTRCVDSYRQLVAAHVRTGPDRIRIVPEGKDATVRRVRVAPLDKAEAQRLKEALAQADPRLGGAYIVDLRQ
jgi:hypothetical protein